MRPVALQDGDIILEFKTDSFLGGYILMERLYDTPTQPEHFEKTKEQLHLLLTAGNHHRDIKTSNTFHHNVSFTSLILDFGFSHLENQQSFDSMSMEGKGSLDLKALEKNERRSIEEAVMKKLFFLP